MSKASVFFLAFIAAILAITSAISDAEIEVVKADAIPVLAACGEEFKISEKDVLAAKDSKNIDALNPCFYACFYKKFGLINDSGMFDIEKAKENHNKYLSSKEELMKLSDAANNCLSVNDATVSDGAKGCERAKLLLTCMIKEKVPFSPM